MPGPDGVDRLQLPPGVGGEARDGDVVPGLKGQAVAEPVAGNRRPNNVVCGYRFREFT